MKRFLGGCGVVMAILSATFGTGCGPPPAEKDFLKMVDQTKHAYKAADIRAAALPLLARKDGNAEIPKLISALPLFALNGSEISVGIVGDERDGGPAIDFTTGSGFGHWGIIVCQSKESDRAARRLNGKIFPWEDGVYFYLER
jgi:hypothetical protein